MSNVRGKKRGEEMAMTTMRVSKRTARMASYIAGALGVNSEQSFTAEDVVLDAMQKAYPDLVEAAREMPRSVQSTSETDG